MTNVLYHLNGLTIDSARRVLKDAELFLEHHARISETWIDPQETVNLYAINYIQEQEERDKNADFDEFVKRLQALMSASVENLKMGGC